MHRDPTPFIQLDISMGGKCFEYNKVYVEVIVKFSTEGAMMPIEFIWEDGTKYLIDKVKSEERCASRKAGGTGIMYTVMVDGKECHLP